MIMFLQINCIATCIIIILILLLLLATLLARLTLDKSYLHSFFTCQPKSTDMALICIKISFSISGHENKRKFVYNLRSKFSVALVQTSNHSSGPKQLMAHKWTKTAVNGQHIMTTGQHYSTLVCMLSYTFLYS